MPRIFYRVRALYILVLIEFHVFQSLPFAESQKYKYSHQHFYRLCFFGLELLDICLNLVRFSNRS